MSSFLKILALSVLVFSSAQAQTLETQTFEDQFGEQISLTEHTQWLVFAFDKVGGEWVKTAFEEANVTDLAAKNALYVSDISAMPGFVTRMFALPKMRDYAFKVALDYEGAQTANWPRAEGTVTLMRLDNLNLVDVKQANSPEQIKAFLAQF
ncbi:MAG: hypothetical protein RBS36_10580 [Thiomicrospira sp.]|jgi:hypothetical protein|nr:hypothetical protein [Thiomicrospira sp.]